jgi:hypothetical protein
MIAVGPDSPILNHRGEHLMNDEIFTNRRKSTFSSAGDNCVEIGFAADGRVALRDTEMDGHGPLLVFRADEWSAFLDGVRSGEFDD